MKSFIFYLLLLILPLAAGAQTCTTATCTASSTSEAAFLAALPVSGNTNATVVVNIPSGSTTWTTGFSYTVPTGITSLTIQGATSVTFTGTPGTSTYASTPTDNTVITDGYNSGAEIPVMSFVIPNANQFFRITGLTFNSGTTGDSKYGEFLIGGATTKFRFDHNHTIAPITAGAQVRVQDSAIGVMDHNVVDVTGGITSYSNGFQAFDPTDDTIGWGDGPWSDDSLWGSANFLFFESNIYNGGAPDDCAEGGRFVMRYNNFNSADVAIQTHATKSDAGAGRGCRAFEAYHNYITGPTGDATGDGPIGSKGGTALIWGNSMPQGYYRFFVPSTDRNIDPANVNESAGQPTAWGYCGTNINGTGSTWDGNQSAALGYPCLDGIGRGKGDALNGADTISARRNTVTGTQSWPRQVLEPIYLFMNNVNPASGVEVEPRDQTTTPDRDYYSECNTGFSDSTCPSAAFNGSHGTGYGTLASRPSSCTAGPGGTYGASPTGSGSMGVGYWATDQNSGNGELYVCTATNTWTSYYQPYVYPHPLVSGTTLISTTTTLTAASSSPTAGSSDLLTATVASSSATGTVTFYDGVTSIGTGTISSGVATFTVTSITTGSHPYSAVYGGDSTYATSTSSTVTVTASSVPTSLIPSGIALQ